jgi:hypothetical protein
MAELDHSALGLAGIGWRDAFRATATMPVMMAAATLATIVIGIASLPNMVVRDPDSLDVGPQLAGFVLSVVQGFFLTPVAIAVHRYVLLGEATGGYPLNPRQPRFMRFFAFSVVFQLLIAVPGALMSFAAKLHGGAFTTLSAISITLFVLATIVSLRMLILFPAIAVDANSGWLTALRDSKGHTWFIFFTVVLATLPVVVIFGPIYVFLLSPADEDFAGRAVGVVLQSMLAVASLAAFAAIASRLYRAYAQNLGRPAGILPADA